MYISARQLLLTTKIGDGCIYKDKNCNTYRPILSCMAYKFGPPSQTIKSNKCNSLTGE